ncbi:MAG: ribose ABC transporter permease [Luteitalea sp.]|nr:ribose ABC transporter permease [Luteitalea sp.]
MNRANTYARTAALSRLLRAAPALLLASALLLVGLQSDRFLTGDSATQILAQAAPTIVVAVGMTFVLLTGGVDLSVGALMFIAAGLAGHLALGGWPLSVAALAMVGLGLAGGAVNAWLVTRFRLVPFVATLSTLYIGRGLGRWITETRAINLPEPFLAFGAGSWLGIPLIAWVAAGVALVGQFVLSSTPFGRQLYALGASADAARKTGIHTIRTTAAVYVISGGCAGLAGLLALSRLGTVSPRFGELYEFEAITAAVLGGTSLYGGRGRVLPGTVAGALLLKTIFSALVILQANPYLYPLITAAVIFAAVLLDTLRRRAGAPGEALR